MFKFLNYIPAEERRVADRLRSTAWIMKFRQSIRSMFLRLVPPKPKPLILLYHRIADDPIDPWSLSVSPSHFAQHLEVVRRTRHPLSLTSFVHHFWAGTLREDAVAITFDDGYVDNLSAGKPRLAAADVPATVFLATGYLGRPAEFWWDELARLILTVRGPRTIHLPVGSNTLRADLGDDPPASGRGSWRAWDPPRTAREAAYVAIHQASRPLNIQERDVLMDQLRVFFPDGAIQSKSGRAMTFEEVQALASDNLVGIGAHTVTHPLLTELDAVALNREIVESKQACEEITKASVAAFAYPYGNFNAEVSEAVKAAGFAYACSAVSGPITTACDILALPRVYVHDDDGDAFELKLRLASAN
jgi:peptidoglycan/xylan/chitin deacetylase (PgdA/CDA1 family)